MVVRSVDSTAVDPVGQEPVESASVWHPLTRIAFRFVFAYVGLFCLVFAQITFVFTGIVGRWLPENVIMWQLLTLEPLLKWIGSNVFGVDEMLHRDSGSGDQALIWVLVFTLAVAAVVATALWSALDRRRTGYARLHAWFLVFVRLCLGGQMLLYGFAKVIPTQMPEPPLVTLLQPYGSFSPMSVLWLQVGSAPAYEILLGSAELVGGLLLFLPRTATLGAMVSLVSMAQVFVLNMTFDVPVKILSFHLLVLALVLLAPQARRLANLLVLERTADPVTQPPLFATSRANRIAALVQVVIGLWVAVGLAVTNWDAWYEYGGGMPKSPLYGIWEVTDFRVDGVPVAPLTTDPNRVQRIVFENPGRLTYQLMDGTMAPAIAEMDDDVRSLAVSAYPASPDAEPEKVAEFTVDRPTADRMTLDGVSNGRDTNIALRLVDPDEFPLRSRGFHWVQEYPYVGGP